MKYLKTINELFKDDQDIINEIKDISLELMDLGFKFNVKCEKYELIPHYEITIGDKRFSTFVNNELLTNGEFMREYYERIIRCVEVFGYKVDITIEDRHQILYLGDTKISSLLDRLTFQLGEDPTKYIRIRVASGKNKLFENKTNELFDTDELKSKFELPYMRGDISKEFSPVTKFDKKEDSKSFYEKCIYKYNVLGKFHLKVIKNDEFDIYGLYGTSYEPLNGVEYYGQIGLFYENNKYTVSLITRDLLDSEDQSKWDVDEFSYEDINKAYRKIYACLKICEQLNIIKKDSKININNN